MAEMRHSSWMHEEALGTLIDYRIGFANIDQAPYTKAMPPASLLTSRIGYVRLHGRNPQHWEREFGRPARATAAHDYLYSPKELQEWKQRIEHIQQHAATTFVFANNDAGGKSRGERSAARANAGRRSPLRACCSSSSSFPRSWPISGPNAPCRKRYSPITLAERRAVA